MCDSWALEEQFYDDVYALDDQLAYEDEVYGYADPLHEYDPYYHGDQFTYPEDYDDTWFSDA